MMPAFLIDQVQEAACGLPLSGQGDFIKKDLTLRGGGAGQSHEESSWLFKPLPRFFLSYQACVRLKSPYLLGVKK